MAGIPAYIQIREVLRNRIVQGKYRPHERLPGETALAEEFSVTRMTLRRAVDDLVAEGLLYRSRGRGTFVRARPARADHSRLQSFCDANRALQRTPSSRLLEARALVPDPTVSEALEIDHGQPVFRIVRVRLADNEPVAYHEAYVPCHLIPDMLEKNVEDSLYAIYREYGLTPTTGEQVVEARSVGGEIARHLGLAASGPHPVLYVERISRAASEVPVEFLRAYYRADRYSLYMVLKA